MAMKQVCDRYGTTKEIKRFRIALENDDGTPIIDTRYYLSPRGLQWAKKMIQNGIAKLDGAEGDDAK